MFLSLWESSQKTQPSQRFEKEGCITFSNDSENLSQSSVSPTGKVGNAFFLSWFGCVCVCVLSFKLRVQVYSGRGLVGGQSLI